MIMNFQGKKLIKSTGSQQSAKVDGNGARGGWIKWDD